MHIANIMSGSNKVLSMAESANLTNKANIFCYRDSSLFWSDVAEVNYMYHVHVHVA